MLTVYNTLSRKKEPFIPLVEGEARVYVCGITVYDYCHVGHARSFVAFDIVRRWLVASGLRVTFVRNITDVDDKIIGRAVDNGESIGALTARYIDAMHEDEAALAVLAPDKEPRATQFITQMLEVVDRLQANGLAYVAPSGDVCYPVRRIPRYGRLSGKSLDDLRAGERVEVSGDKQDPLDFVLWKSAKPTDPREVCWPSRHGAGRPGWHLECSAMSTALLGAPFDIHGGGMDLQFPHHENEIAQSDGALFPDGGHSFVRYWMHNGFVQIDDEKMSKSLGNFSTVRDVLQHHDGEVIRFFILRAHYRSPLNYSSTVLDDAREGLLRLYGALDGVDTENAVADAGAGAGGVGATAAAAPIAAPIAAPVTAPVTAPVAAPVAAPAGAPLASFDRTHAFAQRFAQALDDDFNTPVALAVMFDLATQIHRDRRTTDVTALRAMGGVLGILQQPADVVRRFGLRGRIERERIEQAQAGGEQNDAAIADLVRRRDEAKRARDFAAADAIRSQLRQWGIELRDSPTGTTWQRR